MLERIDFIPVNWWKKIIYFPTKQKHLMRCITCGETQHKRYENNLVHVIFLIIIIAFIIIIIVIIIIIIIIIITF